MKDPKPGFIPQSLKHLATEAQGKAFEFKNGRLFVFRLKKHCSMEEEGCKLKKICGLNGEWTASCLKLLVE
jgi:hypothetical protein